MKTNKETEYDINKVLKYQKGELNNIKINNSIIDKDIATSEKTLLQLGYDIDNVPKVQSTVNEKNIHLLNWEELLKGSEINIKEEVKLEDLFTEQELLENRLALKKINSDYNSLYKLDKNDITICAAASLLGSAVDILLTGIPKKTKDGLKAKPLADYIRAQFEKAFPSEEMEKLANSSESKVPFDAQDNRNTNIKVEGLSSYYHRLLSLGHDPILGFVVGVIDILRGTMTTIDKNGHFVIQTIEKYEERKETDLLKAITKEITHLKSDITTSMGLPPPFMALFNFLQFGNIGEEEQTIAEIIQGMYYEGFDFIHFCSQSISSMVVELVVRIGYAIKRIKEGNKIRDSIPISLNREKHLKLATMLFIAHSGTAAINAGKIYFTKNPMAINYAEWLAFGKYSYKQFKWVVINKPKLKENYVNNYLELELNSIYSDINGTYETIVLGS